MQHMFSWTRGAQLLPLQPGSAVIAISSAAAVHGPARQRRAYRHLPPRAGHRIRLAFLAAAGIMLLALVITTATIRIRRSDLAGVNPI